MCRWLFLLPLWPAKSLNSTDQAKSPMINGPKWFEAAPLGNGKQPLWHYLWTQKYQAGSEAKHYWKWGSQAGGGWCVGTSVGPAHRKQNYDQRWTRPTRCTRLTRWAENLGFQICFLDCHFQRLRYRHQSTSFGFGTHRSCVLTVIQRCKPGKGFRNERQCCFSSKVHTVAILSQFLKERLHMTNDWKAKNKQSERTSSKQRTKSRQCNWSFLQVPGELKDVWPPYSRALKSYRWLKHNTCHCGFISGIGE